MSFISKHTPYHKNGPGSLLNDGGSEIFPTHIIVPYELLSDKHYHVYVKYAYVKAFLNNSMDLEKWKSIYIKMQEAKGRIPNIEAFNTLINSIKNKGFQKEYAIPIDENYDILDGSHRLSIALALDIPIYVKMFSKYSKNYEKKRLSSCSEEEFDLIEKEREILLKKKKDISKCSLMTVWGSSLSIWNELFQILDLKKIKRSFLRTFSQEEYLTYIAALYAGDGISHSSLTRKSWALEKFGHKAGVFLLNINPEELQDLKIKIREKFINKIPFYHFDSIVHTVDNLEVTPILLSLIEPYKPMGDDPLKKSIITNLTHFLLENKHTTPEYKQLLELPSGYKKIPNLVNKRIELVIFDLDGVIADSELISAQAYQMILAKKNIFISLNEASTTFCGISKKDAALLLKEKYGVQFSPEDEKEKQIWIREQKLNMKQVPQIQDIIKTIICPKCIASGSSLESIKQSLDILNLRDIFPDETLFSAKDVPNGKPEPDLFIQVSKKFHINPDNIMIFEDSIPGIIAANRANMNYIWIGTASHIPFTYTNQILQPLTRSEYFRKIEQALIVSNRFKHLLNKKNIIKQIQR